MTEKTTLKEQVHQLIIDGIIRGEYSPNQILNEQELVKKYNMSKSPVREALLLLCNEGIITNIPRFGYQINGFTISNMTNILEFRMALESFCLKKCFSAITEQQLLRLDSLTQEQDSSQDIWGHWEQNMNFHLTLASFCENEYLYEQLKTSMHILKIAYAQFYWSQWNSTSTPNDLKNHKLIILALRQHDLDNALLHLDDDLKDFCLR